MPSKKPILTYEFGTLYIKGQNHYEGDVALEETTFNHLWNFILSNKATNDVDAVMSVHTRGGRRYIKIGRYVGTIQTKDGQTIEILPKIYDSTGEQNLNEVICRKIFLNMLKHFTDAKAKSFQQASLDTKKGFPILEIFISNYISKVEQLVVGGLKKGYSQISDNCCFLKGRLDIGKHITRNVANQAKFAITYNKYVENIPHNRIIATTLRRLMDISNSPSNRSRITTLLGYMDNIPLSANIENDLQKSLCGNRLFSSYEILIRWSSQFLLNKGFTTFSGSHINQSLLFQADKLFEDFVAFLFKKYVPTYTINTQHNKYYLVDKHNERGLFRLRPDIVIEGREGDDNYNCVIIDTKWKSLNSYRPDKNYLIDIKDMYQLYAYGQKYRLGQIKNQGKDIIPKLVLIYPYSENFTERLPDFIYEDIKDNIGLKLMVVPFDLTNASTYESQVHNIIRCLDVDIDTLPTYKC